MPILLRGALVEYRGQFLGPLPNAVVFQFNPEQLARTITIPPRPTDAAHRAQTGIGTTSAPPIETFTITAQFSAADSLGAGGAGAAIPRLFGVGPQLAALEKMVHPRKPAASAVAAAVDAVGSAISAGKKLDPRNVPRPKIPKLLFIWGTSRVLPVTISSMTITEKEFDFLLNPVQAEVAIGLEVASDPSDDIIAKGALTYTNLVKDAQATLNLVDNAVQLAAEIISF